MSRYDLPMRRFAEHTEIRCSWCKAKYNPEKTPVWYFKANAEGYIGCWDCRRKHHLAWGKGPWSYFPDLLKARGVTYTGSFIKPGKPDAE